MAKFGLKELALAGGLALMPQMADAQDVESIEHVTIEDDSFGVDSVIEITRNWFVEAILISLLASAGGIYARRKLVKDAVEKLYNESIQISIHTFKDGVEDNTLHIERVCRKSIQEVLDSKALCEILAKSILKKRKGKTLERSNPLLEFPQDTLESFQYRLSEYCEEILRRISPMEVIDARKLGKKIKYKEFVVTPTYEYFEDAAGTVTTRLILIPSDEAQMKVQSKIKTEAGKDYQILRVETHNAIVSDYYGEKKAAFLVRIPVGIEEN